MKKVLVSFILVSFPLCGHAGKNMASLSVSAGTASTSTYVQILVVDPLNRETGFNPDFKRRVKNIPGSSYVTESVDAYDGSLQGEESAVFAINNPMAGNYRIIMVGFGNANYSLQISAEDSEGNGLLSYANIYTGMIALGTSQQYLLAYNPIPGAPAPVITKVVTFDALRADVSVARKLNQLGEDKFAVSLVKNIDLAEKLAGVCDKRNAKKDKCEPATNVLRLFVKRLELANRKCDNPSDCDEEREWTTFRKGHGGDAEYKDFFHDWDKDEWHKQKKTCKRFVSDEALKIISEDAQWLIKSLGGEASGGKR